MGIDIVETFGLLVHISRIVRVGYDFMNQRRLWKTRGIIIIGLLFKYGRKNDMLGWGISCSVDSSAFKIFSSISSCFLLILVALFFKTPFITSGSTNPWATASSSNATQLSCSGVSRSAYDFLKSKEYSFRFWSHRQFSSHHWDNRRETLPCPFESGSMYYSSFLSNPPFGNLLKQSCNNCRKKTKNSEPQIFLVSDGAFGMHKHLLRPFAVTHLKVEKKVCRVRRYVKWSFWNTH